jgi:hypothetical protein
MAIEFKQLDECNPRDLVRLKAGERAGWALVGSPGSEYRPILILNQDGSAECHNVVGSMEILKPGFEAPALCYGQNYIIEPNHAGTCDLSSNAEPAELGSLILTRNGMSIKGSFVGRQAAAYYDLASGKLTAAPGGPIAVFGNWTLSLLADGHAPNLLYTREPKPQT